MEPKKAVSENKKEQWNTYFKTALKYGMLVGLVLGGIVGAKIIGLF